MLKYIRHNETSKAIYFKARILTEKVVFEVNLVNRVLGTVTDELEECLRGILSEINQAPRINVGYLSSYIIVVREKQSVKVYHRRNSEHKKLLCEVVKEGGEG